MTQKKQASNTAAKKGGAQDKSKRSKVILLSILGAAVLVTATVLIVLQVVDTGSAAAPERPILETGGRGTFVTMDNLEEVREQLEASAEDAYFSAVMSVEWTFERWNRPSRNAYVENSTDNNRTVYFDVFLDETGERVFESPYLPVGAVFENFALQTRVPAGEHSATVVYFLVDDDYDVITDVSVKIRLTIIG